MSESLLNSAGVSQALEELFDGFLGLIWVIQRIFGFADQVMLE